jgi:hypothetical protein
MRHRRRVVTVFALTVLILGTVVLWAFHAADSQVGCVLHGGHWVIAQGHSATDPGHELRFVPYGTSSFTCRR